MTQVYGLTFVAAGILSFSKTTYNNIAISKYIDFTIRHENIQRPNFFPNLGISNSDSLSSRSLASFAPQVESRPRGLLCDRKARLSLSARRSVVASKEPCSLRPIPNHQGIRLASKSSTFRPVMRKHGIITNSLRMMTDYNSEGQRGLSSSDEGSVPGGYVFMVGSGIGGVEHLTVEVMITQQRTTQNRVAIHH